jgi:hypothetical protein
MDAQQARLGFEELDARIAPGSFRSAFPFPADPVAVAQIATAQTSTSSANHHEGTSSGSYTVSPEENGPGPKLDVTGTARLAGIGHFNVTGFIHQVGEKAGRAGGHIALSDGRGMLVLQLTGPEQHAGRGLPGTFSYKVIGGTGAFHFLSGHGSVHLTITPNSGDTGGTYSIRFN